MKKLLILSIAVFTLFSCSSNDDDNLDLIVGTWTYTAIDGEVLDDCDKKSQVTFNENNSYSTKSYYTENGDCVLESTINGTWENNNNNTYSFSFDGDTNTAKVTFSNNDNTLTLGENEDREVYTRIN